MIKVTVKKNPKSAFPEDVQEYKDRDDFSEYYQHMSKQGYYVMVEQDGRFLYDNWQKKA